MVDKALGYKKSQRGRKKKDNNSNTTDTICM